MTITAENITVCQEALYLLRQDVGIPSVADAEADTSLEWKKSKIAFDAAISEVWNAHDWNAELKLTGADLTAAPESVARWTTAMRSALAYCVASELAIPLAGRVQDLQNWRALYGQKLAQARVRSLQTELDAITDTLHKPVLRLILPNFTPSDDDLPRSIKTYTDRIDAEKEAARAEVWNAHDWVRAYATATSAGVNWNAGMSDALVYLLASKLAMPTARKEGEPQGYDQLYRDKLAQARVAALQVELDAVSDTLHKPVLRLILPNFTPSDDDLPRSIKTYTDRIDAEKEAARAEVWNAHDWVRAYATATSAGVNWNAGMSDALVYLLASKLAMPTARKEGEPQGYDQLYRDKLAQARVAALEAERKAVTNQTHNDILALLVPHFDPADGHLPRSIKVLTDRADALADSARYAVLSDHDWNFARAEELVPSCEVPHGCGPYPFASEIPPCCAHLEAVFSHGGRLDDWKVFEGRIIVALFPVVSIVFTRDDRKPEKWPPLVRRAFLFRLAADVSQTEVPKLFNAMEAKAAEALVEARARDARESNTPRDAWGRNYHVDAMRGIRPGGHLPPHRPFHGIM